MAPEYYSDPDPELTMGKKASQYMADMRVPARLKRAMPTVKLVAILRDPVERTFFHYRMGVRHRNEQRSFDEAVGTQLGCTPTGPHQYPLVPAECYVAWSEYGRILQTNAEYFDRDSFFVLFTRDVKNWPAQILQEIFHFLEVDDTFVPDNAGTRYHRGTRKDLMHSVVQTVRRVPVLYPLWTKLGDAVKAPVHNSCKNVFRPLWFRIHNGLCEHE